MALNYNDRNSLLPQLTPRVAESIRKYFLFLEGGGGGASAGRQAYAAAQMKNVPSLAIEITPWLSSETAFIDTGTSITDGDIQSRVESVLNEHYLPE